MPGIDSNTKLCLHCNGADGSTSFPDASDQNHTVTANATAQVDTAYKKWGTGAVLLDGNSDYLSSADSADWDICSLTDFTVDLQVRHIANPSGTEQYITHVEDSSNRWHLYHAFDEGLRFLILSGGSTVLEIVGDAIADTAWHHVALIKTGTAYAHYLDGNQVSFNTNPNSYAFTASLEIGRHNLSGGGGYFAGHFDEVRVQHDNYFAAAPNSGETDTITVPTEEYAGATNVTVTPDALIVEVAAQSATIKLGATVQPSVINVDVEIQAPTIEVVANIVVTPGTAEATTEVQSPTINVTAAVTGFDYRIEILNTGFNRLSFVENEATDIQWQYDRIGGCGAFSFSLPREFDDQGDLGGDYDIRIHRRANAGTYSLWYSGFIEDRTPILGDPEKIEVKGFGYSAQLSRVVVNGTYASQEVSVIVKDILDTYVTPNTDITYSATDITATTFTVDTISFKTSAMNALRTLAEIAGTREWGVGADRKFFFKARSTTINYYYQSGYKIKNFSTIDSFREIINRLYIEGGEVGGTKYELTINDTDSQTKYGLREQVVSNASIVSSDVGSQYGAAILAEKGELSRRAKIVIVNEYDRFEDTVPLGEFVFRTPGTRYNENYYGEVLYGGDVEYQINKIQYKIGKNKSLIKTVDLGQARPSLAENIEQIEYKLDTLREARA